MTQRERICTVLGLSRPRPELRGKNAKSVCNKNHPILIQGLCLRDPILRQGLCLRGSYSSLSHWFILSFFKGLV